MSDEIVTTVRKEVEYQTFIKLIGEGKIPSNWEDMADAIGVHPNTITAWKKLPEFQEALIKGIDESMANMTATGKRDWRMWRERYSMLMHEQQKGTALKVTTGDMSVEFLSYGTTSNPAPVAADSDK